MARRIPLLLVTALLLVCAATAAGCGGDNDEKPSGAGDSSSRSDPGSGAGSADRTVARCLAEAEKAPEGEARNAAKKLCESTKGKVPEKIEKSARDVCLDVAKQVPADQRDLAEAACKEDGR